ncbi:AMP-binding protein [Actinophytocola oryzae]|uniref:AMP-binding enzyme n=1 Tax=Actinophytocola oryzae TaxID=502181 RepID=A0A4R7VR69_9PSEU|nr:AMP-binding protein [Actinophytocola oryzae]TDV52266.1 AMP-binding enzyme [Actinophytocola oryzae]
MTTNADLPIGSVDVLPSIAAAAWPTRAALRTGTSAVTFAELDRAISSLAAGLRRHLGGEGLTVVVSALPGLDFPTAFYAIVRSGNVAAPVDPRMPADELADFLSVTRAHGVVLGRAMYERVAHVLSPSLELTLLLDAPTATGVLTCAELATTGPLPVEPRDRDERLPAAIMSGLLTHHALKRRAAAMGLSPETVVLNAAPVFDATQLCAGVLAGATQLLSRDNALRGDATHVLTDHGLRDAS